LSGYLGETHSLVWAIDTPEILSEPARLTFEEGPVYVSIVSFWELIIERNGPHSWQTRWIGGIVRA
jgi:PIN domain nuclease of toxin-antitoxin system